MKIPIMQHVIDIFFCKTKLRYPILLLMMMWIVVPYPLLLPPTPPPEDDVRISFSLIQKEFTVGDIIPISLEIYHPSKTSVSLPNFERTWRNEDGDEFEIRNQPQISQEKLATGGLISRATFEVVRFSAGTVQTPSFQISLSDEQGNVVKKEVARVKITINSLLSAEKENLRDLKPQIEMPTPPGWLLVLAGLLTLLTAVAVLWWWSEHWRKKRSQDVLSQEDSHYNALDDLAAIEALDLISKQAWKEYYARVSDALRRYIEKQLRVPALESTTAEIKTALFKKKLATGEISMLVSLFQEADLVKFARYLPNQEEARQLLQNARLFIQKTTPTEEVDAKHLPL